jgi:diketogulonate reductase-like aldo/keto reductase
MYIPTKKLSNGFEIPVYGFGMWLIGGKREQDYSRDDEEIATIRAAIDMGVTHFDTAEGYAKGHSEEILGKAMAGYNRKKLFIATKVSGENQSYADVLASCEASLKRLDTDYIDLYLLHSFPDTGIDITQTMHALDALVDAGNIKNIGVANFTPKRFVEAQKNSNYKIVCNQLHYNVKYREAESSGSLQYSQDNDVMLVAWRPLQKNSLSQSMVVDELCNKYNKSPNQIYLSWLMSQRNVVTIAKTSSIEHLKENLGAVGWDMDHEDIERLRLEFPDQETISDTYPLDYPGDISAY